MISNHAVTLLKKSGLRRGTPPHGSETIRYVSDGVVYLFHEQSVVGSDGWKVNIPELSSPLTCP